MKRLTKSPLSLVLKAAAVIGLAFLLALPAVFGEETKEEWKAPARAARKKNPVPADANSIAVGKQLYIKECLTCHGEKGKGDGPQAHELKVAPGDLSKPAMWQQTDGELFWKITEGKKPMPSQEKNFTEEQRWHVVNYVRTLAPRPDDIASKPTGDPASQPAGG